TGFGDRVGHDRQAELGEGLGRVRADPDLAEHRTKDLELAIDDALALDRQERLCAPPHAGASATGEDSGRAARRCRHRRYRTTAASSDRNSSWMIPCDATTSPDADTNGPPSSAVTRPPASRTMIAPAERSQALSFISQ